jgi:hypothetical protein
MHSPASLPPFWGPPLSTLPPDARLPALPSQVELDAALAFLDRMADQDTERRMRKVTKTARPGRKGRA